MSIFIVVLIYFAVLFGISRLTSRKADNDTFYRANRKSPWYMVAFGMIGASISGVTFVSVPGMVLTSQMTYLQMCLGFIAGYLIIAFVLLPLFYRLNLTSIYTYLGLRLGERSYLTGASFFLLSKMTGAAVRFYVVCIILQQFVFDPAGIPFALNVLVMVLLGAASAHSCSRIPSRRSVSSQPLSLSSFPLSVSCIWLSARPSTRLRTIR